MKQYQLQHQFKERLAYNHPGYNHLHVVLIPVCENTIIVSVTRTFGLQSFSKSCSPEIDLVL